jgi:hypothetical protein
VFKGAAAHRDRPRLVTHQAGLPAVGTRLVVSQLGGLLGGRGLQSAGHQTTQGGNGDRFHGRQIDLGVGSVFAEGLLADDFAPTSRLFVDSLEVFRGESSLRHAQSLLEVRSNTQEQFPLTIVGKPLAVAK